MGYHFSSRLVLSLASIHSIGSYTKLAKHMNVCEAEGQSGRRMAFHSSNFFKLLLNQINKQIQHFKVPLSTLKGHTLLADSVTWDCAMLCHILMTVMLQLFHVLLSACMRTHSGLPHNVIHSCRIIHNGCIYSSYNFQLVMSLLAIVCLWELGSFAQHSKSMLPGYCTDNYRHELDQ